MDISQVLVDTLSNVKLWAAICSTIFIITLGFILLKIKVLKVEWKTAINSVVLKVALPALAFTGFMKGISIEDLKEQAVILGVSFAFYIIGCLLAWLWVNFFPKLVPIKFKKNSQSQFQQTSDSISIKVVKNATGETNEEDLTKRALVMWMMLIFGAVTSFGLPIVRQLYDKDNGTIAANIWIIPFRIFLYSYCFMAFSGIKFSKNSFKSSLKSIFLNPTIVLTFLGLTLWLSQLIPGASSFSENFKPGNNGWFELGVTMPYIQKPIKMLADIMSPLIFISIGMTLAQSSVKNAIKNKWVWVFTFQKLILIPLIIFLVMLALVASNTTSKAIGVSMVILASVPPATVVNAYTMQYKICEKFASECSALTTLLAIIAIPIWIVISEAAFSII